MLFNTKGSIEKSEENLTTEDQALIMEAAIIDIASNEELTTFLENKVEVDAALSEEVLLERTIVKLDKKAKLSKATKMAVFQIAKEKKDPKFKKLLTIWRIERHLEEYLNHRYGNEAARRAKKTVMNAKKSKSNLIKKVANKLNDQLNGTK